MTEKYETLYIADNSIDSEGYIGTREEWEIGMKETLKSWYNEWLQTESEIKEPMSFEEWAEATLDELLEECPDDEIDEYTRLDPVSEKEISAT